MPLLNCPNSLIKEKMSVINVFDLLPTTIWGDIYNKKSTYGNVGELYHLNAETREWLLDMIKFCDLKLSDGIVYASGNGQYGVLGDGRTDIHYEGTPIPIDIAKMEGKRVLQVDAGDSHSLFLYDDGSVYASGFGRYGKLGDGRIDWHQESTPIPINRANMDGKEVIQVAAGRFHSLFLCDDGSVYSCGDGEHGKLGDGRTDDHEEGTPIPIDKANMSEKRVIQVSAGRFNSLFLCEDGSVYASGIGDYGRLGDGRTDIHAEGTPIPIDKANMSEKRVIQVSAGSGHSLFLCEDGSVYAFGIGIGGSLGDGINETHIEGTPIPIDKANMNNKREIEGLVTVSQKVVQVSAGSGHSLC